MRRLSRPLIVVLLGHVTIDKLSDDVLLHIFDSYRCECECKDEDEDENKYSAWWWHVLVHICERWRRIIFASPHSLNLQLDCKSKSDMEATLDIWPALPVNIHAYFYRNYADEDGIIGALRNRDRIAGINFQGLTCSTFEKCVALMQQSFPVLSSLRLSVRNPEIAYVTSDAFLGGSAPRLKSVSLTGIRFPALAKLLSSARDLVDLDLSHPSTDISLEAMVTCLSVLTRLQSLTVNFGQGTSFFYPTNQSPNPSTHTVLPALTKFTSRGPYKHLGDFLNRIHTPLLEDGDLEFDDVPNFDSPQVSQFIHRTGMFNLPSQFDVYIRKWVLVKLSSSIGPEKQFNISFSGFDFVLYTEVHLMEQICTRYPPLLSNIERLELNGADVKYRYLYPLNAPWLEFLQPFTAVKILHLSESAMMLGVSRTLRELSEEEATGVLPALHTLLLERDREDASEAARLVEPFIATRKHSEHPVVLKLYSGSDLDPSNGSGDTE